MVDLSKIFIIQVDTSSEIDLGEVLPQKDNVIKNTVAYASRKL